MKILGGVVGAILFIALGVGGTLAFQAITDDEPSEACEITSSWAEKYIRDVKDAPDDAFDAGTQWTNILERMDKLLDIRFKACNP